MAKIGAIIKNLQFCTEFNTLLGKSFGMSKLSYEGILGNFEKKLGAKIITHTMKYELIIKGICYNSNFKIFDMIW